MLQWITQVAMTEIATHRYNKPAGKAMTMACHLLQDENCLVYALMGDYAMESMHFLRRLDRKENNCLLYTSDAADE